MQASLLNITNMYTAVLLPSPPPLNVSDDPPPDRMMLAKMAFDRDQKSSS
jgi:hypothetical protein